MSLKIEKVLNNNAVVTIDDAGREVVLFGAGIAFQKKYGGFVSNEKVEKKYYLDEHADQLVISQLFNVITTDYFEIVDNVIELCESGYGIDVDKSLLISLSDHIFNSVKRFEKNIVLENELIWEIKQIYPTEFKIGKYAVKIINEKFNTKLDDNEASFIALHILEKRLDKTSNSTNDSILLIKQIMNILTVTFDVEIDDEALNYYRLITHLKFFIKRMNHNEIREPVNKNLISIVKSTYPQSAIAVNYVKEFLAMNYDYSLTESDETYLIIHVANIFEKDE